MQKPSRKTKWEVHRSGNFAGLWVSLRRVFPNFLMTDCFLTTGRIGQCWRATRAPGCERRRGPRFPGAVSISSPNVSFLQSDKLPPTEERRNIIMFNTYRTSIVTQVQSITYRILRVFGVVLPNKYIEINPCRKLSVENNNTYKFSRRFGKKQTK